MPGAARRGRCVAEIVPKCPSTFANALEWHRPGVPMFPHVVTCRPSCRSLPAAGSHVLFYQSRPKWHACSSGRRQLSVATSLISAAKSGIEIIVLKKENRNGGNKTVLSTCQAGQPSGGRKPWTPSGLLTGSQQGESRLWRQACYDVEQCTTAWPCLNGPYWQTLVPLRRWL
eukprot:gene24554-biopygen7403